MTPPRENYRNFWTAVFFTKLPKYIPGTPTLGLQLLKISIRPTRHDKGKCPKNLARNLVIISV